MVRTRQRSFLEERVRRNYIELDSCGKPQTGNMLHVCDDNIESDESGYIPRKRRRLVEMSSRRSLRISARQRLADANAVAGPSYITRRTMRAIKKEQELEVNNDRSMFDGDTPTDDEPSLDNVIEKKSPRNSSKSIRRSTRQRKSLYDTLNQSWILGSKPQDFSPSGSIQNDDKAKDEIQPLRNDDPDCDDDMYSRVKNRRKSLGRVYGLEKRESVDRSEGTIEEAESEAESEDDDDDPSLVLKKERLPTGPTNWNTKSSEEESHSDVSHPKYYLRQKKPTTNRFQVPVEPSRQRKGNKNVFRTSPPHLRSKFHMFKSPAHKSPAVQRFKRHAAHNSSGSSSSSTTSSSGEDERRFERRKAKSMARARNRCLPMNINSKEIHTLMNDRIKAGSNLADVDPMSIDRTVTFENIGGLGKHVQRLKEMILFPLLYPEVFEKFKITPPRGVLFYGPPGTGKTLVARALANECSRSGERNVAFFMRKGADCLSKWVGESERQLRLLFDQAYCMRPSIIFFDEIDGLAPVRSSRQDQIHSSIVSTLLALMDGLDSRGEVVVIGATNRIDAIDPALRRPGRFDREFHFPLPSAEDRENILKIHTKDWVPKLSNKFIREIALNTAGYCGADLKALCAEVALSALKRRYPQIYHSHQRLQIDLSSIQIQAKDFFKALGNLVPAKQRSTSTPGHPLSVIIRPLLQTSLNKVMTALRTIFPVKQLSPVDNNAKPGTCSSDSCTDDETDDDKCNIYVSDEEVNLGASTSLQLVSDNCSILSTRRRRKSVTTHRPRLLIVGKFDQGQSTHLAPAILHSLERFPVHRLDLPTLFADTAKTPEESCNQVFQEARNIRPCVLYLPHVGQWWDTLSDTMRATFLTLLQDIEPSAAVLLLATNDSPYSQLPDQVKSLFSKQRKEVFTMQNPNKNEREDFFSDLIMHFSTLPPKLKRKIDFIPEDLPVAPLNRRELNGVELKHLEEHEESTLRELRLFLREILYKLARDRRFSHFTKPVDTSEVTDYLDVVKLPMDLETMLTKIDTHKYETVSQFLDDVDLICHNALEYNPDKDPCDKMIRHRACALRDAAHSIVDSELDPEFEKICQDIIESRKKRGCSPSKFAPRNYKTLPRSKRRIHAGCDKDDSSTNITNSVDPHVRNQRLLPINTNEVKSKSSDGDAESESEPSSRIKIKSKSKPLSESDGPIESRDRDPKIVNMSFRSRLFPRSGLENDFYYRRRRSFWFGANRRRIYRRSDNDSTSTSPDAEETRVTTAGNDTTKNVVGENSPSICEEIFSEKDKLDTEDAEHLNSDLSKDSGTACTTINDSTETKEDNKTVGDGDDVKVCNLVLEDSVAKDVSSGFSSEDGNNESEISTRLSAGGCNRTEQEAASKVDAPPSPPRKVAIDNSRLERLLDNIVRHTEDCTIDVLERFHCALQACINRHRRQWDKTELVKELESQLETFKKQYHAS